LCNQLDCGTETEHYFKSKWIIINRRLLRRCNSISDQTPQLKSSFGGPTDLVSLQQKLSNLSIAFEKLKNIFKKAKGAVRVLIKDVSEILNNKTLEKKNTIRIVQNLLDMTIEESLQDLETKLRKTLAMYPLSGAIKLEQQMFCPKNKSIPKKKKKELEMPFTPETVVKNQKSFSKKASRKIKKVNAKALEELMDEKNIEVKGLRDILKKSKKGFKDFLRSFGWSDHEIEDAMKTASIRDSPQEAKLIKNKVKKKTNTHQNRVKNEYQLQQDTRDNLKSTFTKNIVIKEYIPCETNAKNPSEKTQSDFFSKQTNCLKPNSKKQNNIPNEKLVIYF
jgi:murein DD-endopeptidase MepM/ murein hydrolase activator NlpD